MRQRTGRQVGVAVWGGAVALAVAGCGGASAPGGRTAPFAAGDCAVPSVIAHRGETGDGRALPENSAQAELDAAAEGATYLNLDVRWTSDAVPVALHDPTVDRTTSARTAHAAITTLTAAQYTALNQRTYAGDTGQGTITAAHPQTLAHLLADVAATDRPVIVQMEADPFRQDHPATDFANLAQVIRQSSAATRVIVAGWTLQDLAAFHAEDPQAVLAYLFETIGAHGYPTAAQLKAVGARILYLDFRGVTAAEVTGWHAAGLKVWAWTPSSRREWEQLRADGVDAVATDWAQAYLAWASPSRPCGAQY